MHATRRYRPGRCATYGMGLVSSYFVVRLLWSNAVAQDLPCHPSDDRACGGVRDDLGTNVLLSKVSSLKRMSTAALAATTEPMGTPPAAAAPAAESAAAPTAPAATTEPTATPPASAAPETVAAAPPATTAAPAATTEPTTAPPASAAPDAAAAAPPATTAAPAATTVTTTMSFPELLRNADCDPGEGMLGVRLRKEIRDEAPEKWALLKAAWRSIGLSGTYNWFGERHDVAYGGGQDDHGGPTHTSFLPFHRMLGLDLENVLRQEAINAKLSESRQTICSMTVPYWDWTDRQLDMVLNSEYLGGTDAKGCIANGLPAGFETPATFFPEAATDTDPCVKRNTKMRPPSYDGVDAFETVSTTRSDYLKFSERVEKLHNDMHYKIGGNMLTRVGKHSPSDPVFFFHHQFIDMLWYVWQKTNRDVDVDEMRASLSKVKSNNRYELAPWITSYDLIHDCVPMPGSSETPAREDTCLRYESHLTPSDPCAALRDQIKNGMCTADDFRGIPCVHSPECTEKREPALCADEDAEDCDEVVTLDEAMEKSGQFCQTYVLPTDNVHCHSCSYLCGR